MIVAADSVSPSDLIRIMHMLQLKAEARTNICPNPISLNPGRKITKVPRRPKKIAIDRQIPIFSLKKNTANIAANIGAVNESAVASVKGVIETPVKNAIIAKVLIVARVKSIPNLFVFNGWLPNLINHGSTAIMPKTFRKNTIWNGCMPSETRRMHACMPEIVAA